MITISCNEYKPKKELYDQNEKLTGKTVSEDTVTEHFFWTWPAFICELSATLACKKEKNCQNSGYDIGSRI